MRCCIIIPHGLQFCSFLYQLYRVQFCTETLATGPSLQGTAVNNDPCRWRCFPMGTLLSDGNVANRPLGRNPTLIPHTLQRTLLFSTTLLYKRCYDPLFLVVGEAMDPDGDLCLVTGLLRCILQGGPIGLVCLEHYANTSTWHKELHNE
jgi:hypothetical protein